MVSGERIRSILASITIYAYSLLLWHVLLSTYGLPSFDKGVFSSATIAFQMEEVVMVEKWGLYIPWCTSFDVLRFYPPLGFTLMYLMYKVTGDIAAAAALSYFSVLTLLLSGFYTLVYRLTRRISVSLLATILLPLIHGYFSTIAVYWEYTRVLGEALFYIALAQLYTMVLEGGYRNAVKAGLVAALLLLAHLILFIAYAAIAAALLAYMFYVTWVNRVDADTVRYSINMLKVYLMAFLALSGWWLIPAIAPYGLAHYLRVKTPLEEKLAILASGLELNPPLYTPTLQPPFLALTPIAIAAPALLRRPEYMLPLVMVLILFLVYGQGARLIPTIGGLTLATVSWLAVTLGRVPGFSRKISTLIIGYLALLILLYAPQYIPKYHEYMSLDMSFVKSDEYMIAKLLPPYRLAYVMWGPKLRGNQWVNLFNPTLPQVLAGFMEGCLDDRCFKLDYVIKNSLDWYTACKLLDKLGVKYVVVDRFWLVSGGYRIMGLLEKRCNLTRLKQAEKLLHYSVVYVNTRVSGEYRLPDNLWLTPAKVLGIIASCIFAAKLVKTLRAPGE